MIHDLDVQIITMISLHSIRCHLEVIHSHTMILWTTGCARRLLPTSLWSAVSYPALNCQLNGYSTWPWYTVCKLAISVTTIRFKHFVLRQRTITQNFSWTRPFFNYQRLKNCGVGKILWRTHHFWIKSKILRQSQKSIRKNFRDLRIKGFNCNIQWMEIHQWSYNRISWK